VESTILRVLERLLIVTILLIASAEPASALPVFARRYQTACTTCHALIPKLNPFGIAFRNNGYRIPINDEQFVKTEDVSLGAPAWKRLWPKAVWPGAIPSNTPIAIRVASDVNVRPSQPVNLNFDFPNFLNVYFAGPAGDTVSFFGQTSIVGSTNNVFLDRAYAQFRISPEEAGANWLNLKVGRIDTRAEPFSSTFRRTTGQNNNASIYRVLSDGFRFQDHDVGMEIWGVATGPDNRGGLEYGVGIVQGTFARPENNNYKDRYWSASYKVGGMGVAGSRIEEDALASENNYSELSLAVGAFGYYGKAPAPTTQVENHFSRRGLKFDAYLKPVNLFGAYVSGRDLLQGTVSRTNSNAFFVQADYMMLPWVMPVVRYEKTSFSDGRRTVREWIPAVNLAIRANVKLLVEGRLYAEQTGSNEALVRLDFLF
jgi:hypothetical protein